MNTQSITSFRFAIGSALICCLCSLHSTAAPPESSTATFVNLELDSVALERVTISKKTVKWETLTPKGYFVDTFDLVSVRPLKATLGTEVLRRMSISAKDILTGGSVCLVRAFDKTEASIAIARSADQNNHMFFLEEKDGRTIFAYIGEQLKPCNGLLLNSNSPTTRH